MNINISDWVDHRESNVREFRQAIHTLIVAVAKSKWLNATMVMKGAILLALEFHGARYTKDIDFSTDDKASDFNVDKFLDELSANLIIAVAELPYELDSKIQSHEMKPPFKEASFPTLEIRVGYAKKGTKKHERLMRKNCPTVLSVDYSFNETNVEIDTIEFTDGAKIRVYSLSDLVAEKFRAILQQVERDRYRRQDAYDIYCLMQNGYLDNFHLRQKVLTSLIIKAESRNIAAAQMSMRDPEIIEHARRDYPTLQPEIEGELPPFEVVYGMAREYYESLPWH